MKVKKPRVVALGTPKYVGQDYLEDFKVDFDFDVLHASNHEESVRKLPQFVAEKGPIDAFIIRMGRDPYRPFDAELFKPLLPRCRIVVSASAGYDDFDVDWLTKHKIWFCNSVDAVAESTADMAMFLILAVLRDTYRGERDARNGTWKSIVAPSKDPTGMTLGIIGLGAIGKYIAKKALAFNMKIKYYSRQQLSKSEEEKYNATYCPSLHELLSQSDVVSINCPLNKETTGLISSKEFAVMKDGSFLVNTARGPVVDEAALIEALESGKIMRAGLDVFNNEPNINEYFKTSEKVICQPHVGGLTELAFMKSERECFENIKSLYKVGRPVAPVNEVQG